MELLKDAVPKALVICEEPVPKGLVILEEAAIKGLDRAKDPDDAIKKGFDEVEVKKNAFELDSNGLRVNPNVLGRSTLQFEAAKTFAAEAPEKLNG
jgi:hypothetical protein